MRERDYISKVDTTFSDFVKQKKSSLFREENLRSLDDSRFLKEVKSFG